MNAPLHIPPMAADDRLPHDKAVWRAVPIDGQPPTAAGSKQVSIEFHDGSIISDWAHQVSWFGAKRWRFGWPPMKDAR